MRNVHDALDCLERALQQMPGDTEFLADWIDDAMRLRRRIILGECATGSQMELVDDNNTEDASR
jgi:hypothetical protein